LTWTTLDDPLATNATQAYGISGNTIVGSFVNASGIHGFVYSIPEPSGLILLVIGGLSIVGMRVRRATARGLSKQSELSAAG
jgi:hypothetical protein